MKAIVFDRYGDPAEVLEVRDVPIPEPGPGQVRVRMIAAPINPSDLMMIRGQYGVKPTLPATPGFEGVGVVESAGSGLLGRLRTGKRVAVLNGKSGNWAEHVIVPARQVVPVSSKISDEQAASFFVNPATAIVMTKWVLRVPSDAWLLQTAAGSALGRMIVKLAKRTGFKTINVVRRREQAAELQKLGGDAIVCTADESIEERVRKITGSEGVKYALDCVGGQTGSAVVRTLGPGGRMLVYGTLANEPLTFDSRILMVGAKSVEGFWLSSWVKDQGVLTMLRLFRSINRMLKEGVLTTDVGATFPMSDIQAAVRQADQVGKAGKVLLRIK
ncbi:MAG: zinc-dependent alcohol dehydrogenase family protein [Gemmataceae bacterium]|nr:zinc-dependent alcohol dehydrogenase family protein [Gemmataceae bacterium]